MKPRRKSRRARLPVSIIRSRRSWSPSEGDWRRIEKACPFLQPEDRPSLEQIMVATVVFAPGELAAPFVDDAKRWLTRLERAAADFRQLAQRCSVQGEHGYIQTFVQERLNRFEGWQDSSWSRVVSEMADVVEAIRLTREDVETEWLRGIVEGQAWELMVRDLSEFAAARNYPLAAPKGTDKSENSSTPGFVILVKEVQNSFPEDCRRPCNSDIALAEAITVARRGWKRKSERKPS